MGNMCACETPPSLECKYKDTSPHSKRSSITDKPLRTLRDSSYLDSQEATNMDQSQEPVRIGSFSSRDGVSDPQISFDGCFILKLKSLKVPFRNLDALTDKVVGLDVSGLKLMLSFRDQLFMIHTLKRSFHQLNQHHSCQGKFKTVFMSQNTLNSDDRFE